VWVETCRCKTVNIIVCFIVVLTETFVTNSCVKTFFHCKVYMACVTKTFRRMPNCHRNVFNIKKGWHLLSMLPSHEADMLTFVPPNLNIQSDSWFVWCINRDKKDTHVVRSCSGNKWHKNKTKNLNVVLFFRVTLRFSIWGLKLNNKTWLQKILSS
jgi:hypothetical protein